MQLASDAVIRLDDVTVTIGGARLLANVSTAVCPGEAVALLGSNGSGKSTLVRATLGQIPITRGDATIFGVSPSRDPRHVQWDRIGYVPQRLSASSGVPATAAEVVETGLLGRRRWRARRTDRSRVLEALDRVGVADLAERPFGVLSGGQAQRVVIARALIREPDLLLLDEPLAGVDILTQSTFASSLAELHHGGTTILMVLHELGPFAEILDRAVVLRGGVVVHDGELPRPEHAHGPHGHGAPDHDHLHIEHVMPTEPQTQQSLP